MNIFIVLLVIILLGALLLLADISMNEPVNVEFGKPLAAADLETYLIFLQHCFRNGDNQTAFTFDLGSSTHPIGVIIDALIDTWPRLVSDSGVFTAATGTAVSNEQVLMNFGRLIRSDLDADAQLYRISQMDVELTKNAAGALNTGTECAALESALKDMWFLIGAKLTGMFGEWSTTKYLAQDDAFAGWIAALQWAVIWVNLHDINYMKQERGIAEYSTEGGIVKGHFKPLVPTDPSTYGALLVEEENGGFLGATTPINLLGMDSAYVDEPLTKGFKVVLHQASANLAKRLLSKSEFTWRFNRFITVDPGYQLYVVENQEEQGEEGIGLVEATIKNRPMKNYTNITHLSYRRAINSLVADFQSYFFKNKAFAGAKKMFTTVNIYDLPEPGVGSGGLLAFQMTSLEEQITNADKIFTHVKHDLSDNGICAISMRRTSDGKNFFQVIGDVSLDDYRLRVGLALEHIYIDGAKVAHKVVASENLDPFSPYAGIVASFTQNEDEPKKVARLLYDLIDGATKGDLDGLTNSPVKWVDGASHVYGTTDYDYPISIAHAKTLYYEGRASDPFKKLDHKLYDVNELDFTRIADTLREAFGYNGGVSTVDEIPVSAAEDKPWEKKDEPIEVSAEPEKKEEVDELATSAVPDAKIKKMEKALKVEKDNKTKADKKEADAKKLAEAKAKKNK